MDERLLNLEEVMNFLNVSERWLRSAIQKKAIPYYKIGAFIRFKKSDLLEWVENAKVEKK